MIDQEALLRKCFCDNPKKVKKAVYKIGLEFGLLPDKQRVWDNLVKLTSSEKTDFRNEVLKTLTYAFPENEVLKTLTYAFPDVPDKEKVWKDLTTLLTSSEFYDIRIEASRTLRSVFQYQPDKQKVWEDLHELIFDKDSYVQ